MPFGTKAGANGKEIDFNRIYDELLQPALESAGFDVFRADQEQCAGDIRFDMFQKLLVADLVVADLTLDNPNVWYELGVRHALRSRGVMLVQGPRPTQPFDIYTDRKLSYHLKNGAPEPAHLKEDREALTRMARETQGAWSVRSSSPVYQLLPELREPDWRHLMLAESNEFSDAQLRWAGPETYWCSPTKRRTARCGSRPRAVPAMRCSSSSASSLRSNSTRRCSRSIRSTSPTASRRRSAWAASKTRANGCAS